jgi:hypothetical protein
MRRVPTIVFSALALLWTAGGAAAEDDATPSPEQSRRRSAEILAHIQQSEVKESWLSYHLDRIRIDGDAGLEYRRPLNLSQRDLELRVRGPALDRKTAGLTFEIRF